MMKICERFKIVIGDITNENTDAIVNAANTSLLGGGGVDGAIHRKAGKELLEECRKLNGCRTGYAKITKGYNLKSKYVIHTVGPIYRGGNNNEDILLHNAYKNSLKLAVENNIKSIAFPSISTGVYSYPLDKASRIAVKTILNFLGKNDTIKEVKMVCFDKKTYDYYLNAFEETEV